LHAGRTTNANRQGMWTFMASGVPACVKRYGRTPMLAPYSEMQLDPRQTVPEASDGEVIAAVLAGDTAQFATLLRRYNQALFRACRAVLRDATEAEDAVQAAWVSAFRGLAGFRADASFRTWLTRIGVHEASSRLRKRHRLALVPLEATAHVAPENPAREALNGELGRLLERQIDALPEGLRMVLVLRDVVELDTAETAAALDIGEETVRVRLHRARHALADAMSATILDRGISSVWRFDGERCGRIRAFVMAAVTK
jgi:RNA polymerase sigma-70 factor (ECF subfamily)